MGAGDDGTAFLVHEGYKAEGTHVVVSVATARPSTSGFCILKSRNNKIINPKTILSIHGDPRPGPRITNPGSRWTPTTGF